MAPKTKPRGNTPLTPFRLGEDILTELDRLAAETGLGSRAEVLRWLVREEAARRGRGQPRKENLEIIDTRD